MDFYLFLKLFVEILQNLNRFSCRLYSLLLKLLEHQPYVSGPKQIENKQIQVKKSAFNIEDYENFTSSSRMEQGQNDYLFRFAAL